MSQLPEGTLGDAVGVLIFTFVCLITNILLLWLFWINNERFSYIALVGYFALLCTTSSIIQQIYNYTLWNDLAWAQLHYIKANYKNADVIFNNGNFGFMRILAIILELSFGLVSHLIELIDMANMTVSCVRVTMTMYNFWATRRNAERVSAVIGRVAPIILAAITIGLLQTPAVQSSFAALAVTSCAVSIVLLSIVIRQYVMSKLAWRRVQTTGESGSFWSRLRNSSSSNSSKDQSTITPTIAPVYTAKGTVFDDNWVVVRLSIAVVLISAFIVANIVTHLPQADDVARDAKADAPDLGPERARSNIIGDFRQIMYETFVPRSWRRKGSAPASPLEASWDAALGRQQAHLSGVAVDAGLQLDDLNVGAKRRPLQDKIELVSTSTSRLAPSNNQISRDEQISIG
ncbi:hypothetical protein CIB48_g2823 [Xylaria polymorpha]|nr:hypothetical protein CIB48_g2823 [Xylaria polymorpha]